MGPMTIGFRKLGQVGALLVMRFELTFNPSHPPPFPETIVGLMSTAVDPTLVETSPRVCLGFS